MTQEEKDLYQNIILVGEFMEVKNLFPFITIKDEEYHGVYVAEDNEGSIDYSEDGINWYKPNYDWNDLIAVCKKFDHLFEDFDDSKPFPVEYVELCDKTDLLVSFYEIKPVFEHIVECVKWYNNYGK